MFTNFPLLCKQLDVSIVTRSE